MRSQHNDSATSSRSYRPHSTFNLLYLLTIVYHPILPSPFATAPLLQATLHLLSLCVVLPSLYVLEVVSTTAKGVHFVSLSVLAVLTLLIVALPEFRHNGTTLSSLPALALLALSLVWAIVASRVVQSLSRDYRLGERVITVHSQHAQPKWERCIKVVLSVVGTSLVSVLLSLVLANVALDAFDHSLQPPGQHVTVDLGQGRTTRIHMGVEHERKPQQPTTHPTAIFFPPIGASGYTASHWLRRMVIDDRGDTDGHLALPRAIWFDRFGTGMSDYVRQGEDLSTQARGLIAGMEALGLFNNDKSSNNSSSHGDQFILVALHDGSLLANVFASLVPSHLVHSQILIDAETPTSYYSTDISAHSGLRRGFPQSTLRITTRDLVPALLSPLNPARVLGAVFLSTSRTSRVLGQRHAFAPHLPPILDSRAPSTTQRPYLTLLAHDLDAAQGVHSHNFHLLNSSTVRNSTSQQLSSKPTAVLSSFWKLGLDAGWAEVQRQQLVKHALHKKLVGWWKVGSRDTPAYGGDEGLPEGLCANEARGRIWCEEAIRKVLAWRDGQGGGGDSDSDGDGDD